MRYSFEWARADSRDQLSNSHLSISSMAQTIEGQFGETPTTRSVDTVLVLNVANLLDAYPFDRDIVAEQGTAYLLQYGIRTTYEGGPFLMTASRRSLSQEDIPYGSSGDHKVSLLVIG